MKKYNKFLYVYPPDWMIMMEAVINPESYNHVIIREFYSIKKQLVGAKSLEKMIDILNKKFLSYKIIFDYEEGTKKTEEAKYGINSGGTDSDREISIYIYLNDLFFGKIKNNFHTVAKMLLQVFGHEIIHREQAMKIGDSEKIINLFKDENPEEYALDKLEIMSFAWIIVESMRNKNHTSQEILKMLQNGNLIKNDNYRKYIKIFPKGHSVRKRLNKYIYQYLTGQGIEIDILGRMKKYNPLLEQVDKEKRKEDKKIEKEKEFRNEKAIHDFCENLLKTISKSFFGIVNMPVEKTKTSFKSFKITFPINILKSINLEKIKNILEKQFEWGKPEGSHRIQFDKSKFKKYYISILYDEKGGELHLNFIHGYDGGGHSIVKKSIPRILLPNNLDTKLFGRFFSSYARMMRESGNEQSK